MISLPRPELILTHEGDLDGFVSGILLQRLARKRFGDGIPLRPHQTYAWRQRPMHEKSAWVSDLAFDSRVDKPGWLIVDHHEIPAPPQNAQLIHDPDKSASRLAYELCLEDGLGSATLDRIVHLSDVADLFLTGDPVFDESVDYARLVRHYQFHHLYRLLEGRIESLLDHPLLEVVRTMRRVEDPISLEWGRQHLTPIVDGMAHVDIILGDANRILHRILWEQRASFRVLVSFRKTGNGMIAASLRSLDGEASKVAKQLQGGGHPNAAGAMLPRSVRTISEAVDYVRHLLRAPTERVPNLHNLEELFNSVDF